MRLMELYEGIKSGQTEQGKRNMKYEWLYSKLDEIKELVSRLRERGESLNMQLLISAINRLAEEEGLRKGKVVRDKRGKRTVHSGIKFNRSFIERFLKENGII